MRLLLFGGSGQVGSALRIDAARDWTILAPSSSDVSLESTGRIRDVIIDERPDAIVNAAAFTAVDLAEDEPVRAHAINGIAPGVMAAAAADVGCRFVHLSTDYVFDGTGGAPYAPGAATNPINVYGASKLEGERAVQGANDDAVVLRTAWVHAGRGTNFVGTAVRLLKGGNTMRVVDDQVGTPTAATTVAKVVLRLLDRREVRGVHHVTDAGVASWFDVACAVRDTLRGIGALPPETTVVPVSSRAFPRPARRPAVSILATHHTREALDWEPLHWRDGVVASTLEWGH